MVATAWKRLKSESGASLVAALLFFVLCGVGASVILAASSASAGKMQKVPETDQKRFAVESAAGFLRDELKDDKTAVKITDVRVIDTREEDPDYTVTYVYEKAKNEDGSSCQLDESSILGSCVKDIYSSLEDEDGDGKPADRTSEQKFKLSVQTSRTQGTQTNIMDLDQLQTSVDLTMDPEYKITAIISDTQTDEDHRENRCERKLTVTAKTHTEEMEEEEEHEETNENGDVTSEWSIITTTRVTTIYWEKGMIEKTHPDTGQSGG